MEWLGVCWTLTCKRGSSWGKEGVWPRLWVASWFCKGRWRVRLSDRGAWQTTVLLRRQWTFETGFRFGGWHILSYSHKSSLQFVYLVHPNVRSPLWQIIINLFRLCAVPHCSQLERYKAHRNAVSWILEDCVCSANVTASSQRWLHRMPQWQGIHSD